MISDENLRDKRKRYLLSNCLGDAEGRSESAQLFEEGVTEAEHDQMRQASRADEKSDEREP